ncbi:MAG: nodulation protein NfeD [Anaerolineae bacterium]|nr:nodulation protein NfeD [Anaerolineae bacterium]MDW7991003.1 nodulation protein NfeD [Anaerolineae bacterium]
MRKVLLVWLTIVGFVGLLAGPAAAQERTVYVLTVDGAITAAIGDYIGRGIRLAEQDGVEAVVIRLNTPGGDLTSTTRIMERLENAKVPVIVYVWPRGGMAASAGTLILLAAHGAAMAPRTTIGAAHPVAAPGTEEAVSPEMLEKVVNVMAEHARLFAERRGEAAAEWAQRAIRESATAGPDEALEAGVIDLIAEDLDQLLKGFDGRTVRLGDGREIVLHTAGAKAREIPLSPMEQLLQVLINPNIAFILLTIGVQAILMELASPGGWVAGFIGVLCLALAAYALGVLPFNWLGLVLLAVAIVLFILDIKAPTHGALTAVGTATFIAGALILFNAPLSPYGQISIPLVVAVAILTALFFAFVIAKALQAQKPRSVTGQEGLVGQSGVAKSRLDPEGWVLVSGELWRAVAEGEPVEEGNEVEVLRVEGFRLYVRKK